VARKEEQEAEGGYPAIRTVGLLGEAIPQEKDGRQLRFGRLRFLDRCQPIDRTSFSGQEWQRNNGG
jgi:hypothetical protein